MNDRDGGIDVRHFFSEVEQKLYLAGAGISMEPPSCLPSARTIMDAILAFITDPETIASIKQIPGLRYEYVVQMFRDSVDDDLKVLDFFERAMKPNFIHQILAKEMKNKNCVLTTNFDYLIETAFGLADPRLKIIISETDFNQHSNIIEIFDRGLYPLYKIHGSKKNSITGEDTKKWVITTLDAIGKHKKDAILSVPVYEEALFENVGADRELIVLGYSGSDDLDIMPALRLMKHVKRVVWVEHELDANLPVVVVQLKKLENQDDVKAKECVSDRDLFLQDFLYEHIPVFILKVHTGKFILIVTGKEYLKESSIEMENFNEWLKDNFKPPGNFQKHFNSAKIFQDFGLFKESTNHFTRALDILKTPSSQEVIGDDKERSINEGVILSCLGMNCMSTGEPQKALEHLGACCQVFTKTQQVEKLAHQLINIGMIYQDYGMRD
nr:SIR2 family protein [Candidatus Sigynarchaeota archaeon]